MMTRAEAEPRNSKQDLYKAPGEEDQEITIIVQQLIPLRVEPKSSLASINLGVSYNAILTKGTYTLTSLVVALVSWRSYMRALAWDLSRTHNAYTLLRILANYHFMPPGACCPRLCSDADEPDEDAADVSPRTSLRFRGTTKKDKDT